MSEKMLTLTKNVAIKTKKHFSIFVIKRNSAYALFSIQFCERLSDSHNFFAFLG